MSWAAGRRRCILKTVSFTPEEWEQARGFWQECRAARGHATFSGHARELIMWGSVRQVVMPADTDTLNHELMKIGVNVNQVAHLANTRGTVAAEDVERMEALLAQAVDLLAAVSRRADRELEQAGWQS